MQRRTTLKAAAGALALLAAGNRAWAAESADGGAAKATPPEIPILVYHHVVPGRSGSEETRLLYVTPDAFERQLAYLRDNGYEAISFDRIADWAANGTPLPERPVILSFDDGWANQFDHAFPLLQKYGVTGTFFVVSAYLDHENFMSVDQLKTLQAAGMTIGGHSRTHPALAGVAAHRLTDELVTSKQWLEGQLATPIESFAYPYGSYNAAVVAATRAAGYRMARTVDPGTLIAADHLATLPGLVFSTYVNHFERKPATSG